MLNSQFVVVGHRRVTRDVPAFLPFLFKRRLNGHSFSNDQRCNSCMGRSVIVNDVLHEIYVDCVTYIYVGAVSREVLFIRCGTNRRQDSFLRVIGEGRDLIRLQPLIREGSAHFCRA